MELLTSIAVLGLLASIVVPQISAVTNGEIDETKNRRNAQSLVTVCTTADAAGLNLVVKGDLEKTIRKIIKGGCLSSGVFKDRTFSVPGMAEGDIEGVKKYLRLDTSGTLTYSRHAQMD